MSDLELSSQLIEAAKSGDLPEAIRLLNAGADMEAQDKFGSTALLLASTRGHATVVSFLLDRGANLHVTGGDKGTPLHCARNREIAWVLLAHGASLEARDEFGSTPLHWAVGESGCLDVLLDWGADIEAENAEGYTPLWHAIDSDAYGGFAILILRGASVALMKPGTIGRKVYNNDWNIFLRLSKMILDYPGLEHALRAKRPDVMATLLDYQINNAEFMDTWERTKRAHLQEIAKRKKKLGF